MPVLGLVPPFPAFSSSDCWKKIKFRVERVGMLTKGNRKSGLLHGEELKVVSTDDLYLLQLKQMSVVE